MANYEIVVDKAKGEITLTVKTEVPLAPEDSLNAIGLFVQQHHAAYEEYLASLKLTPPPKHIKEQTEDGVNRYIPHEWLSWYAEVHPGNGSRKKAIAESLEAVIRDEFNTPNLPTNYRISCDNHSSLNPEIILERIYTERR